MAISVVLLIAAFISIVGGVLLLSIPVGVIVGGLLLAVAGAALIRQPEAPKGDPR